MVFVLVSAGFAETGFAAFVLEGFREAPYSGVAVCPVLSGCGAAFALPQISPPSSLSLVKLRLAEKS